MTTDTTPTGTGELIKRLRLLQEKWDRVVAAVDAYNAEWHALEKVKFEARVRKVLHDLWKDAEDAKRDWQQTMQDAVKDRVPPQAADALEAALALVARYRKETPLGHQPHMIAHEADALLARHATGQKGGEDE